MLSDQGEIEPENFQCDLLGDIKLHYDLAAYIEDCGLSQIVNIRGEVSYEESIRAVAACDGALLLQPGTTTQIPSKLFEYIGLGKRILTIAPPDSAVSRLIDESDLGWVADPADVDAIAAMVRESLADWRAGNQTGELDPSIREQFDVRNSVQQLASALDKLFTGEAQRLRMQTDGHARTNQCSDPCARA